MLAAINDQPSVVELLLKHGADQEMCDTNGKKAAELASALGHSNVVCLLSWERPSKSVCVCVRDWVSSVFLITFS